MLRFAGLFVLVPALASAQMVTIDHTNIDDQYDGIVTSGYQDDAEALRVMFVNRSVGANIDTAFTCTASTYAASANSCKRHGYTATPNYDPDPELWEGTHSRANVSFFGWPGVLSGVTDIPCNEGSGSVWQKYNNCFIDFVTDHANDYDVFLMLGSYLDSNDPALYIATYEALIAAHPTKVFLWATSSLSRDVGQVPSEITAFNAEIRSYASSHSGYLFDLAAISSHTQAGVACYDNRDGVEYTSTNGSENWPDDGLNTEAICPQYTQEVNGGHFGNPDVGKIRAVKGFWAILTRIAGWDGDEEEDPDPPTPGKPIRLRLRGPQ